MHLIISKSFFNGPLQPKYQETLFLADFKHLYEDALREGFRALSKQLGNVVSDYLSRKYEITLLETYKSPRLLSDALERSLGYGGV